MHGCVSILFVAFDMEESNVGTNNESVGMISKKIVNSIEISDVDILLIVFIGMIPGQTMLLVDIHGIDI